MKVYHWLQLLVASPVEHVGLLEHD